MTFQQIYNKIYAMGRLPKKKTGIKISKGTLKMVKEMDKIKYPSSQAMQFVSSRNPTFQYFIDVFALAFIISVVLTIVTKVWK